jgi:hypothetical protein
VLLEIAYPNRRFSHDERSSEVEETIPAINREVGEVVHEWEQQKLKQLEDGQLSSHLQLSEHIAVLLDLRRQINSPSISASQRKAVQKDLLGLLESSRRGTDGVMYPRTADHQHAHPGNTGMIQLLQLVGSVLQSENGILIVLPFLAS